MFLKDEAISAVSHFNLFRKIRKDLNSNPLELEKVSSASQTVEIWPEAHEALFHSIFSEEMRLKNSPVVTVFNTTTTTTVNQTTAVWTPKDLVDQYIQVTLLNIYENFNYLNKILVLPENPQKCS